MFKLLMVFSMTVLACSSVSAQPRVRKFDDPGVPPFKVLNEGQNPPLDAYDNFVIGPKYLPAPERKKVDGVPEGKVEQCEIDAKETKLFNPGIAGKEFGKVDPVFPQKKRTCGCLYSRNPSAKPVPFRGWPAARRYLARNRAPLARHLHPTGSAGRIVARFDAEHVVWRLKRESARRASASTLRHLRRRGASPANRRW